VSRAGAATGSGAGLALGWQALPNPLLPRPSLAALGEPPPSAAAPPATSGTSNSRYVLPVLLSAIVPGAGEISIGHWKRGVPLVAVDVATWILYGHFHTEGEDWRSTYEAFADAHWHETGDVNGNGTIDVGSEIPGWQENLRDYYDGQYGSIYNFYDPNLPYSCTCPYIPKEEDKQHYYENIGKYLYYYPGWDDWAWNGDPATSDSARRIEYYGMRTESNDNFDHATTMVYVGMATRIVSMAQTVLLMRRDSRFEVRPMRTVGRGAGLKVAFRY
jgi:hypothetical protein